MYRKDLQVSHQNQLTKQKINKISKIQSNHHYTNNFPHKYQTTSPMTSKYPSQPYQKIRALYKSAQNQINNGQLNRITQDRMNKRYAYTAKQVQKKEQANDKEHIQEMIFYRNKFHSLVVLVGESMRESYNKNKFQTEVKNILKDDWDGGRKAVGEIGGKNNVAQENNANLPLQPQQLGYKMTSSQYITPQLPNQPTKTPQQKSPLKKQPSRPTNRSLSPLQQFFQTKQQNIQKSKHLMNFQSVIPKSQLTNSKLLSDIKQMNKKSVSKNTYRDRTPEKVNHEDSKLRDLRRENQELNRILRKRQYEGSGQSVNNNNVETLEKQVHHYQKVNQELRMYTGNNPKQLPQYHKDESPYSIPCRQNNVHQITYRNLHHQTSRKAMQKITSKSPQNKSQTLITNSKVNDSKSNRTNPSSIVQKEKELYINSTPQILFENQLIKILVVRFPLRIHEKNVSSSNEKLNPQENTPNQQKLQIMILNNASKYVKNQQLYIKLDYDYDTKHHQIRSFKKQTQGYSKVAETSQDIVYREIVKVKLLSREGYNQEIKALVKAEFTYNPDVKKKRIFNESLRDKRTDNFSIEVKLPVTFIQFSSKPFSSRDFTNRKTKLTIKPNPLYDTVQHAYMNTNLPFLKSSNPRVLKEHATLFGRSFIHDSNGKGSYLESEIDLAWFEKRDVRYISIQTIEEWVYLLAYIFLDVEEEEEQFEKEFKKPSMHVFFNLENKQYV